jgi:ADP-ribose pyrophosphatase YjhB (NUDIX family)/predicted transcriptional regulator
MSDPQLHRTQVSILHSLRYAESERFNALMHPTNLTSDTFKFHLRKLVKLGYVAKLEDGKYQLTALGKEYANGLNEQQRTTEKQPKVSILMVIAKTNDDDETVYLLQKRSRNPFYGYWSEVHGRAEWEESFEATAKRQLKRQAGLDAEFAVHSFRRVRDYDADSEGLLEDKLFIILEASKVSGELANDYSGGTNEWLTLEELRKQDKVFASTVNIIESLHNGEFYTAQNLTYDPGDY